MPNQSKEFYPYHSYKESADYILRQTQHRPTIGLILGSGLSPLADEILEAQIIPYEQIPHFPCSSIPGHAGRLVIGNLAGKTILAMQGRVHFYEGYTMQHLTLPVRVMHILGVKQLIVTNAAGGINSRFKAGDLMLITDHLNLVGLGGHNPLRGTNLNEFGERFPSMTHPYNPHFIQLTRKVAQSLGISIQEGIYAFVAGPSFETPAEIRFLRTIGADAVGMSTVPETVVANHAGMNVLGISSITNVAVEQVFSGQETTHEEVLEAGKKIVPYLTQLLKGVLENLG